MNKLHIVSHRGCMWGQTGGGDLRPLFISLHFTPRSSFSYNHCTLPPMCPHNPPKNWFTQNFTRIEIGLGQFLSFRWKQVWPPAKIGRGKGDQLWNDQQGFWSNDDWIGVEISSPKVNGQGFGWNFWEMFFLVSAQLCSSLPCVCSA